MNVTVNKNASGGDDSNMVFNEKILTPKGSNIYVGQWDSIKEKMTWQAVEKGAEVVGKFNLESSINHVEVRSPKIMTDKKIEVERGPFMSSSLKMEIVAGNHAGKKIKKHGDTKGDNKGAKS
ncbi:hypothetical protein FH972_015428 [Carpinus fangiana]|uniref:Uncharacterized protein n=1 Tax=Carpinus fangiana TaxID=176857 RepID=A0A5N6RCT4_9ROSI|nr:hypothetical protein FH972_015428 [Carpinus fangiana]